MNLMDNELAIDFLTGCSPDVYVLRSILKKSLSPTHRRGNLGRAEETKGLCNVSTTEQPSHHL